MAIIRTRGESAWIRFGKGLPEQAQPHKKQNILGFRGEAWAPKGTCVPGGARSVNNYLQRAVSRQAKPTQVTGQARWRDCAQRIWI